MNKKLFEKVKGLCKDTGLSEKYLKAITEKMGGSIEDDSTDDEAIESTANLIAEVAKESQGEATRWANKKKPTQTEGNEKDREQFRSNRIRGKRCRSPSVHHHKCRTFPAGSGPSGEERRRYQAYIRFHEH